MIKVVTTMPTASMLRKYAAMRAKAPNPDELPALTSHHQAIADARIRRLIPAPWADRKMIAAIYERARALSEQTGVVHQVDHIIPLLGDYVSGLHVETNLQVITRTENIRKGKKAPPC